MQPTSRRPSEASPSTRRRRVVIQTPSQRNDMINLRLPSHGNGKYVKPHAPNEVELPITPPPRLRHLFEAKIPVKMKLKDLKEIPKPPHGASSCAAASSDLLQPPPNPPRRKMTHRRYTSDPRGKHYNIEENIGDLDIRPRYIAAGLKRVPYKVPLDSPPDLSPILETPTPTPTPVYYNKPYLPARLSPIDQPISEDALRLIQGLHTRRNRPSVISPSQRYDNISNSPGGGGRKYKLHSRKRRLHRSRKCKK